MQRPTEGRGKSAENAVRDCNGGTVAACNDTTTHPRVGTLKHTVLEPHPLAAGLEHASEVGVHVGARVGHEHDALRDGGRLPQENATAGHYDGRAASVCILGVRDRRVRCPTGSTLL